MGSAAILVLKLGALGDIVLATGPFAAIRAHHPGAHITLLTTKPYAEWLRQAPYFDDVWIDPRPGALDILGWLALRRQLRAGGFGRVYDLQTSGRSSRYFQLMRPNPPEWSGIAPGCSHPDADPNRNHLHTVVRQKGQLRAAGILDVPPPNLDWCATDLARFDLPPRFALLVPGGSAHRPEKRWPALSYAALARRLSERGIVPLLIGTEAEARVLAEIEANAPGARSLLGQTDFASIAALARRADIAIGNDTGPMHLIATAGCRSLTLFSDASDPALTAPVGRDVTVLREARLEDLSVDRVAETLRSA